MTRNTHLVHLVHHISREPEGITKAMTTTSKTARRRAPGDERSPPSADGRTQRAEHILDTAAILLLRWGFRKTTVDDVARAAGVAKGTIYLHWKDKNELFLAAVMRAQQQAIAEVQKRIA